MIYDPEQDAALQRLLDYDRRCYWFVNGWSIRFRVAEVAVTAERPHGIRYSFTLHDADSLRLLGFDNAHGLPREQTYDHRHRFRRTDALVAYAYRGADELICDFFNAVEAACRQEGVAFAFAADDVTLDLESDDEPWHIG